MKNTYFILFICFFVSCDKSEKISITKVEGSPKYENAQLMFNGATKQIDNHYSFSFDIDNYRLGEQTQENFKYNLANSDKGQHIHFIINNGPYFAKYTNAFTEELEEENSVVLAFLSRSYHESVKNPNAFVLTQIGKANSIDLSNEFLFYSRPKGTYEGEATEKLLLDFYLVNTNISPNGNKVRATIQDSKFIIDEWAPYYIEGLTKGEISIKLELIDTNGNLIVTPFNPSTRTVTLK